MSNLYICGHRLCPEGWREGCRSWNEADSIVKLDFLNQQVERLEINQKEDCIEEPAARQARRPSNLPGGLPPNATFATQGVFRTPSAFISALMADLPKAKKLTRDQTLFMAAFAKACDEAWEDQEKEPKERRLHHILLLGQGGSGKTHVVQNLVFAAVVFIWPSPSAGEPSLVVVAASNAQAKNISTDAVKARTLHNACSMRVQKLVNAHMGPGNKNAALQRLWGRCVVLVVEEISMVAAALYNMLDFRSMCGRSVIHQVFENSADPSTSYKHVPFGRIPIVLHLGDFLQLSPTGNVSLVADPNERKPDGSYANAEPPSTEIQHACHVFQRITSVFELLGTKRFVEGDPLIEFLQCMRDGRRFPTEVWRSFETAIAKDNDGVLDPRHRTVQFRSGYGLALYWETLARWISSRAQRDARALQVPLVFLQSADECNTLDRDAAGRLLTVANIHNTGRPRDKRYLSPEELF